MAVYEKNHSAGVEGTESGSRLGEAVEVFSTTAGSWMPGHVIKVDSARKLTVQFNIGEIIHTKRVKVDSKQLRLSTSQKTVTARPLETDVGEDYCGVKILAIDNGPQHSVDGPSYLQSEAVQWYFMVDAQDMTAGASFSDLFVTTTENSDGQCIADLHQPFYERVGGITAAVLAGNSAGYIGGLTINLAAARALHAPSDPGCDPSAVGRSPQELEDALRRTYTELAYKDIEEKVASWTGGTQELQDAVRLAYAALAEKGIERTIPALSDCAEELQDELHIAYAELAEKEIERKVAAVPVGGGNLSFRDYRHMRTGKVVPAVVKGRDTPLFGPQAWEELHRQLRQLAFEASQKVERMSETMRAFCIESNEQLKDSCPNGIVSYGAPVVQCYAYDDSVSFESSTGTLNVSEPAAKIIKQCMLALEISYSNAVFDSVSSIEDNGYAFLHVHSMEMANEMYRHERNKAIIYTVGPNGNKARYPDDVHAVPSTEAWHERTRLVGQNVVQSVASYNRFVREKEPAGLLPITILRTPLISGGAFLLRDVADPNAILVSLEDHAESYQRGLLCGLQKEPAHGLRRVEFMRTDAGQGKEEAFRAGFAQIKNSHEIVNSR